MVSGWFAEWAVSEWLMSVVSEWIGGRMSGWVGEWVGRC